ncbi:superoxide dismutase family protein [Sphingomonas sp.]|uniref:superoxide dismutase family protein n=1 Tax=Sphingomonas sp. TaxID=28214 RepID=UPI001AFF650F|nr:superoxide dismutase family protein [Sphingomonas sp.]MBO9711275.1 superoxide dismutase family protein [Sphingomonas sp.]
MTGLGRVAALALAGASLMGCAGAHEAGAPQSGGRYMAGHFRAEAVLHTADGAEAGRAVAQEKDGALLVTVEVKGLPAGVHGVHIHTTGKCEAPGFTTAGGHWNPGAKQHGMDNPMGMHAGDLPNLTVKADGTGKLSFTVHGGSYEQLLDEDGAAFVVHGGPDDLKSDPAGNSGPRIACGVFGAV